MNSPCHFAPPTTIFHTTGREREWWQQRNIDPLIIASALWQQSRDRHLAAVEEEESKDESPEDVSRTLSPERP